MKKPTLKQLLLAKASREEETANFWISLKRNPIYQKIKENRRICREIQKEILKKL